MEGGRGFEMPSRRNQDEALEKRHALVDEIDDLVLDVEEVSNEPLGLNKVPKNNTGAILEHAREILANKALWQKIPESERLTPEYLAPDKQNVDEDEKIPEKIVSREETHAKLEELVTELQKLLH